jgi:hypothetical protein
MWPTLTRGARTTVLLLFLLRVLSCVKITVAVFGVDTVTPVVQNHQVLLGLKEPVTCFELGQLHQDVSASLIICTEYPAAKTK